LRILITGGAGLVGSHAAEYYAEGGNQVIVLDNLMRSGLFGYDKESVEYNWKWLGQFDKVKLVKGDVRRKEDCLKAIGDGVDVCIHTAGQPGVGFSVQNPEEDFSINALGTLTILEALRERSVGATFVYCSTNKVYGENVEKISLVEKESRYIFKDTVGITEKMPIDHASHTPYGISKYTGDLYAQEYAHIYGMKTGVFRMSCIYGTRQFGFEDQGWIAWFIIASLYGKDLTIYGDGKQVRDVLYVDDLIQAYDKFIQSDIKHAVYNIGGGPDNTMSLLELVQVLEKKINKKITPKLSSWRPSDQKVYISDITKIKKELNWEPRVKPEEGIEKIIEWTKANPEYFK